MLTVNISVLRQRGLCFGARVEDDGLAAFNNFPLAHLRRAVLIDLYVRTDTIDILTKKHVRKVSEEKRGLQF